MTKIIALAMVLLMTTVAMAQQPPEFTTKSTQVECMPLKQFPAFAKFFGLRVLGQFNNPDRLAILFMNFDKKNWLMATVDKKDPKDVCIHVNGNGFDLDKDFIFIDPRYNVPT